MYIMSNVKGICPAFEFVLELILDPYFRLDIYIFCMTKGSFFKQVTHVLLVLTS